MNTFTQYSYRINAFFFLTGLLLLALIGQSRLATLLATLDHMAEVATSAPPLLIQVEPPALLSMAVRFGEIRLIDNERLE